MRTTFRRFVPALVAGTAAALVATACGNSGDAGTTDDGSGQNPMTAYVECMKQHGVELTLPTGRPGGGPSGRPGGWSSERPSGSPGARRSGAPGVGPSGMPGGGARPSGAPGGGRNMFARPDGVDEAVWQQAVRACQSVRPSFGAGGRDRRSGGPGGGNGALAAYQNCLKEHGVPAPAQADATDPAVSAALAACKVLSPAPATSS